MKTLNKRERKEALRALKMLPQALIVLCAGLFVAGYWLIEQEDSGKFLTVLTVVCSAGFLFFLLIFASVVGAKSSQQKERRRLQAITTLAHLKVMSPTDFEKRLGCLYYDLGYHVVHTGRSADYGVDLLLRDRKGQKWVVQCKRWEKKVDSPTVIKLIGSIAREGAVGGAIVTTSDFTSYAEKATSGNHRYKIFLHDGKSLAETIQRVERQKNNGSPDSIRSREII